MRASETIESRSLSLSLSIFETEREKENDLAVTICQRRKFCWD